MLQKLMKKKLRGGMSRHLRPMPEEQSDPETFVVPSPDGDSEAGVGGTPGNHEEMELQCSHAAPLLMAGPTNSCAGCAPMIEETPAMNQHADVFAHLTSASYQGKEGRASDLEHVLERARNAGVSHIINGCEDLQHTLNLLKMSRGAEGVYCAISLDPGVFREKGTRALYLTEVRRLAKKYRGVVVGVTLTGFKNYKAPSFVRRLERALGVAVDQQLPLFLKWKKKVSKLVLNFKELLQLLPTIIIYSFEGSKQDAQTLLDNGFYIGISCRSVMVPHTFEALASLPMNQVLVHSGEPEFNYLNDHPLASTTFPAAPRNTWRTGLMLEGRGEPACVAQ
ncbi:deoxyribonuclease TATDN1-like isoform X2 [Scylla paramamosain]